MNNAIDDSEETLAESLQSQDVGLHSIIPECMDQYKQGLQEARENKLKLGQYYHKFDYIHVCWNRHKYCIIIIKA